MKDQLEDFIRQNRNAFDDREPSEMVWANVEKNVTFAKKTSIWNSVVVWRAAAIVFMVLSIYLLVPKTISKQHDVAMSEFSDVEQFYFQQISEKTELIKEFKSREEGMNGFTHDFKQLEAMYMVLKEEMKNRPSQKVKDAMVLNLLVQIDLLNQQLYKLENEYKTNKEDDEKPSKNV